MGNFWDKDPIVGQAAPAPAQAGDKFWANDPVVGVPDVASAQLSAGDTMKDAGKGAFTGLAKGIAGLAGLPVDLLNLARSVTGNGDTGNMSLGLNSKGEPLGSDDAQDKADLAAKHAADAQPVSQIPGGGADINNFVFSNGAPYQPQSRVGRFAETMGELAPAVATGTEFRTGAALGDGILSTARAAAGDARRILLPTVGATAGGDAADAVGLPPVVGQIAGQVGVRLPSLLLPNAGRMVKDRLGDLSDADIAAARTLQGQGQAVGVPLMGQESFNNLGLQQLAGDVAASPTGSPVINNFLNARPPQVQQARANMLDTLGPDIGPQQAGDTINQAADQRLRNLGQMRSDVATPGYQAAAPASIPDTEALRLENAARFAAGQAGAGTTARARLTSLADAIRDNGSNIGLLDSTRKSFRDNLSNAALPEAADSETRVLMRPVLDDMRDTMAAHNQDFASGLQASRDAAHIVEGVQNSPVGQVMATTAEPGAITSTIGPTRMNGPEVRDAFNELALANPNAPAAATRLFARNATNFPATPTAGQKIADALMGRPDTGENFQAMMRGSEFARGQMPGTISGPVNQTLNVFGATRRSPQINSATAGRTLSNQQAGASVVGNVLDTVSAEPAQPFTHWLRGNLQRRTYAQLADALTSPTSVDDLLRLSRRTGTTPAMRALASSLMLGAQSQANGPQQ